MPDLHHPHLALWGEWDGWIAPADLRDDGGGNAGLPSSSLCPALGIR